MSLQTIFKVSPTEAVEQLRVAKGVLEHWYSTYMQVREKIEVSGRDARWEFSKQMLFERTNYMVRSSRPGLGQACLQQVHY